MTALTGRNRNFNGHGDVPPGVAPPVVLVEALSDHGGAVTKSPTEPSLFVLELQATPQVVGLDASLYHPAWARKCRFSDLLREVGYRSQSAPASGRVEPLWNITRTNKVSQFLNLLVRNGPDFWIGRQFLAYLRKKPGRSVGIAVRDRYMCKCRPQKEERRCLLTLMWPQSGLAAGCRL